MVLTMHSHRTNLIMALTHTTWINLGYKCFFVFFASAASTHHIYKILCFYVLHFFHITHHSTKMCARNAFYIIQSDPHNSNPCKSKPPYFEVIPWSLQTYSPIITPITQTFRNSKYFVRSLGGSNYGGATVRLNSTFEVY